MNSDKIKEYFALREQILDKADKIARVYCKLHETRLIEHTDYLTEIGITGEDGDYLGLEYIDYGFKKFYKSFPLRYMWTPNWEEKERELIRVRKEKELSELSDTYTI